MNKLGNYITQLMTAVIDKEQEQLVKDLALSELKRLNVNISEFINKHTKDSFDKAKETEKQLLQEQKNKKSEDKKNVKNK